METTLKEMAETLARELTLEAYRRVRSDCVALGDVIDLYRTFRDRIESALGDCWTRALDDLLLKQEEARLQAEELDEEEALAGQVAG